MVTLSQAMPEKGPFVGLRLDELAPNRLACPCDAFPGDAREGPLCGLAAGWTRALQWPGATAMAALRVGAGAVVGCAKCGGADREEGLAECV
eukprot:363689-Chlamydomonas_euryale.AAC.7